jgi:ATP-dependent Clp protease, protease subunit
MNNQIMKLLIDNKIGSAALRQKLPLNVVQNGTEASIHIYDIISGDGWGFSALDMVSQLAAIDPATSVLNVHINTPGGSVFEARAIISAIQSFAGKTVAHIDGICASAGTSIAIACSEVVMVSGGFFMIHNASSFVFGDKTDMRDTANLLEKIESVIISEYVTKTGKPADEVAVMMDAETWFTADEALSSGFIDRIAQPANGTAPAPANAWNLAAYPNAPKALAVPPTAAPEAPPTQPIEVPSSASQTNTNKLSLALVS